VSVLQRQLREVEAEEGNRSLPPLGKGEVPVELVIDESDDEAKQQQGGNMRTPHLSKTFTEQVTRDDLVLHTRLDHMVLVYEDGYGVVLIIGSLRPQPSKCA
jgi:hypothetical protein